MEKIFSLFAAILILSGCEKKVAFTLKESDPKLVVEATIENDGAPRVVLTNSLNYFSTISPELLLNSFVHGAEVTISNGIKTHRLKEYSVPFTAGIRLYYYSNDSSNATTSFTGKLNTAYSLKIISGGKEYTSQTTIPNLTKRIDSVWYKPAPKDPAKKIILMMVRVTDPKGYGDYVRYFTRKNRQPFLPGFNSVYDDQIIDGTTYDLEVDPGVDRNQPLKEDERAFKRGDTVTLKLSNIDKNTFDFWRTMEYSYSSIGNPFSSPTKVINNISNGALGYFGGYASQYRTLIIPK
ncbi:MAG: DUF4249 domain-containing protein [Chitinophagaceae bacterium]